MNDKIKLTEFGFYTMVDDTHLSRWVEQEGRLDHARHFIDSFKSLIPWGGTVIDCGTSIGDHTLTYAQLVGPQGRVIGFEANPDVAECCSMNMAEYPWVQIYNIGLSDDYGVAGMDVSPNVGASYLTDKGREVKLEPLDAMPQIQALEKIDFIKVDIEGFEPRFLLGARQTIAKHRPAIVMEVNALALERQGLSDGGLYGILHKLEYKSTVIDGVFGSPQYEILATHAPYISRLRTPSESVMRKKA